MKGTLVPAPVEGFQIESLDGEIVLLHPARNLVMHGNPTGALVWRLCDGVRSVDEITEILGAAYPESREEIRTDVAAAIQMMIAQGVLRTA
jgi:hypothetical protein